MGYGFLEDRPSSNKLFYVKVGELPRFIHQLLDYNAVQTGPQYIFLTSRRMLPWCTTGFESFPKMMELETS